MNRRGGHSGGCWIWLVALSAAMACGEDAPDTQVMVVIDAEPAVVDRIADVELEVTSGTGPISSWVLRHKASLTPGDGPITWPLEVALEPRASSVDDSYHVVATALDGRGETIAQVRAVSGYIEGSARRLPLVFDLACLQRDSLCNASLTCLAGACVDPEIRPEDLLPGDSTTTDPIQRGEDMTPPEVDGGTPPAPMDGGDDAEPADAPTGCDGPPTECFEAVDCPEGLCDGCAVGYIDDEGCVPFVADFGASAGTLAQGIDALETRYTLRLSLLTHKLTLAPMVVAGVQVQVEGAADVGDGSFVVEPVPIGSHELAFNLSDDAGASRRYMLTLERGSQPQGYLKSSRAAEGDELGFSVAYDGDTVAVGAPAEDGADEDTGAVYIFVRGAGGAFELQDRVEGSTVGGARFGGAVALDGDVLVVGSPYDGSSGAVHVFRRSAGRWGGVERLTHPEPAFLDEFGISVALDGTRLVVGATGDDGDRADGGGVFIYEWDGSTFGTPTRLGPVNDSGWFGASVAIHGDMLAVGATGESPLALFHGAAYLFEHDGDSYVQRARVVAPEQGSTDFFGHSVAVDGDVLVVGAPGDEDEAPEGGAVYVFRDGADGFRLEQRLVSELPVEGGQFGLHVALRGAVILTGSPGDAGGLAHVFEHDAGAWQEVATLVPEPSDRGDRYGAAVAIAGESFVIGAPGEASATQVVDGDAEDNSASGAGAAYPMR